MSRGLAALALEAVFGGLAFGYRSWVHWRRTGTTGFIRPRAGAPAVELVASTLFLVALVLLVAAPVADLAGLAPVDVLDEPWSAVAGAVLGVIGVGLTDGVFARIRNSIYSAMVVGLEVQVRRVEEPYLERTHGDAYRQYLHHVGRFVPGVGTVPAA